MLLRPSSRSSDRGSRGSSSRLFWSTHHARGPSRNSQTERGTYQTVATEVRRLQDVQLVHIQTVGRTKLLSANESNPYVRPLTQLVLMSFGPPLVISEEFGTVSRIEQLMIYGSWAAPHSGRLGQVQRRFHPPSSLLAAPRGPIPSDRCRDGTKEAKSSSVCSPLDNFSKCRLTRQPSRVSLSLPVVTSQPEELQRPTTRRDRSPSPTTQHGKLRARCGSSGSARDDGGRPHRDRRSDERAVPRRRRGLCAEFGSSGAHGHRNSPDLSRHHGGDAPLM